MFQTRWLHTHSQVEQATLSSHHAAALARCSESEARCAALEAESKVWAREREESLARAEALRRDHERMTALQQRQEAELEELLDKQSQLRSNNRSLEAQHRELEARYQQPSHTSDCFASSQRKPLAPPPLETRFLRRLPGFAGRSTTAIYSIYIYYITCAVSRK